jgi:hypothetical protein
VSVDAPIRVEGGRLYLPGPAFARYFTGGGGVVLLREGADLMVLPVRHAAAGGYLAKIRNSAGDRVVTAPDFFRAHGLADEAAWEGQARWSDGQAALVCHAVFSSAAQVA